MPSPDPPFRDELDQARNALRFLLAAHVTGAVRAVEEPWCATCDEASPCDVEKQVISALDALDRTQLEAYGAYVTDGGTKGVILTPEMAKRHNWPYAPLYRVVPLD
jgi:hypothetical protein